MDDIIPENTQRPCPRKTYQDLRFLSFYKLDNSVFSLILWANKFILLKFGRVYFLSFFFLTVFFFLPKGTLIN